MPIEIDFENEQKKFEECSIELERVNQLLINFLKENKGKAFTDLEILNLCKIKSNKIYPSHNMVISDPPSYVIHIYFNRYDHEHVNYRYGTTPEDKSEKYYYYYD